MWQATQNTYMDTCIFFCVCGRPSHFSTMKAGLTHESLQEIIPLQRVNVLNGTQQTVPVVD